MTQQLLHTVLVLTAVLIASLGCEQVKSKTPSAEGVSDVAFSSLENAEDVQRAVDKATSHPNAILFVHVDWALMEPQRKRFAEFKHRYQAKYPHSDLVFAYIDCTAITDGYTPLRSLPGWKELEQKNGASLVQGWGELVWCKNGVVLNVERPLNFESIDALIAKTESLGMGQNAK